jgi:hypothetical protein
VSGRLVGEILDHAPADLRPLDFAVLIALAESARWNNRTATHQTTAAILAERVRPISTPSSIRNALARLAERGLIQPLLPHAHRGTAQHYYLARMHRTATHTPEPKAQPPGDANGVGKRNHPVTLHPVDNLTIDQRKRHQRPQKASPDAVTPPVVNHP